MNALRYSLCGLLVFLVVGCGGTTGGKPVVAFVTNNPADFWNIVEAGCKAQAEKDGVTLEFRRPADASAAKQKEIIDSLLAKGVKAISISVQDPKNQTPYLDEVAAKVPLLAIDNDAPKSKRKCYIGTDNIAAGRVVGKLIKEAMPNGGTIALFVGQIEPDNARERTRGVLEELGFEMADDYRPKGDKSKDGRFFYPAMAPVTDNGDPAMAKERANSELVKLNDQDKLCLVGLWAYNPPALLAAVTEQNLVGKVKIVGFDENEVTLKGIEDGHIHGTVVQNPYEFGRMSVETMAKLVKDPATKLPASGMEYIPARIVTKTGGEGREQVSKFAQELKKLLGK